MSKRVTSSKKSKIIIEDSENEPVKNLSKTSRSIKKSKEAGSKTKQNSSKSSKNSKPIKNIGGSKSSRTYNSEGSKNIKKTGSSKDSKVTKNKQKIELCDSEKYSENKSHKKSSKSSSVSQKKSIKKGSCKINIELVSDSDNNSDSELNSVDTTGDDIIYLKGEDNNDKKQNKKYPKKLSNENKISFESFDDKLNELREELRENYIQQKKIMNDIKDLATLHKKDLRLAVKSGNRLNSGKHTGFNKPQTVPQSLKDLLKIDDDVLSRSKVTELMYKYFTDNKMYNSKTKREIIPNSKIKKLFGMKEGDIITFYNMQTWLKKVYNDNQNNIKLEE
ncbi:putative SWIB domain-containing protein [Acanthamoeba polyphaga mimivirus]|uniref:SWIB domain-containing protein n=1 Tax=Acanthamoeba polyphaga mimivirus Kroon TaxID=3069720 RepID=A0A0G2YAY0_9VIRU|nr:putative SWIB domain-containing protein [Acanthamoeba polyphaga mimivirus]AKI80241.1 putative SWIB domain-containing protein [Acanthamoeba polyphaga mimivirus Kroon]